jgi:predicted DNA-binding transcriptional regulator AlpA
MLEQRLVQAREVARTLGIKTGTLAKWRQKGKGPKGWVRLGRTSVAYPLAEVERFLVELGSAAAEDRRRAG